MTDHDKPAEVFTAPAAAPGTAPWTEPDRRFRMTVARPAYRGSAGTRPIEMVVDFPRLLEKAGVPGRFNPASVRVVERGNGRGIPWTWRADRDHETGRETATLAWYGAKDAYDIYFDLGDTASVGPVCSAEDLPPANLLANAEFAELTGDGSPAAWRVEPAPLVSAVGRAGPRGGRSLRIAADESTPPGLGRVIDIAQTVDVSRFAGQGVVFECDLLAERAPYGAPMTVETRQFRADGSLLPTFAVQPRYLSLELAEGQFVQFRESGRFHPAAAACEVRLRFRLSVLDADTDQVVEGPDAAMAVRLDRVVLRPAERWPWPAASHAGFVEGAFRGEPVNGAFEFAGQRRVAFNAASESCLTTGRFNPDPQATHWGPAAGTLECHLKPSWDAGDGRQHVIFEAKAYGHRLQSSFRKEDNGDLHFLIADSRGEIHEVRAPALLKAGRWHHLAATWDYARASLQLFVDGRRIARSGPGVEPWPFSPTPEAAADFKGMGVTDADKRSVPLQAFIGGDMLFTPELSAEAALDDVRISDTVRYQADFAPPKTPCAEDESTRALWRFDGDTDGIHAGDDGWVRGFPACELPPRREAVDFEQMVGNGVIRRFSAVVRPRPTNDVFEVNRAETRLPVFRPLLPPPDPRFVEFVARSAELAAGTGRPAQIRVTGDYPPLMHSLAFTPLAGGNHPLPRRRANDNIVPGSTRTLGETVAEGAGDDAEKSVRVMEYADRVTNYFNAAYCESLPARHRPRIAYTFLKALNIYPFDQCGPLNYMLRKLFLAAGISSNNAAGTHHQFQQAFYRGRWRLFDLSARVYWLRRDNVQVASRRELEDDLWLKLRQDGHPNAMFPGHVSEATFGQAVRPHDMSFVLRTGERAAFSWHNEGKWFELTGDRQPIHIARIPPVFGNGVIVFEPPAGAGDALELENLAPRPAGAGTELVAGDFASPSALQYNAACPYIFSGATLAGTWAADRDVKVVVSFSADGGRSWSEAWRGGGQQGDFNVCLGEHVMARYAWKARVAFSPGAVVISGLRVRSVFVASPYVHSETLRLGENSLRPVDAAHRGPVRTTLRWVERRKTELGLSLNALSFYLDGDRTHRSVFIAAPGRPVPVTVTLQGRAAAGQLALENMPAGWTATNTPISAAGGSTPATGTLTLTPRGIQPGDVRAFDVVFREPGRTRRIGAQLLCAVSPLAGEAEAAESAGGCAAPAELPEASGARVLEFTGPGEAVYGIEGGAPGEYTLWLRARWAQGAPAAFTLRLGSGEPRELRATALIGFTDWDNPEHASAKMFQHYGEQYAHFAWYRVSNVVLAPDTRRLSLAAGAGAAFDALLLLPRSPEMDRAAMNLFHNWNYAPWESPL